MNSIVYAAIRRNIGTVNPFDARLIKALRITALQALTLGRPEQARVFLTAYHYAMTIGD